MSMSNDKHLNLIGKIFIIKAFNKTGLEQNIFNLIKYQIFK